MLLIVLKIQFIRFAGFCKEGCCGCCCGCCCCCCCSSLLLFVVVISFYVVSNCEVWMNGGPGASSLMGLFPSVPTTMFQNTKTGKHTQNTMFSTAIFQNTNTQ
ncbi:unnamed protein product [Polarella glacialis]|uniref:Secreted protein n=1 Tax=Polarella glacialis TaxID=89957 RepID=A0A813KD24_POLGL|nr:unnamed protein product [Polarella glacialis]